jgi:hypothetical protein
MYLQQAYTCNDCNSHFKTLPARLERAQVHQAGQDPDKFQVTIHNQKKFYHKEPRHS